MDLRARIATQFSISVLGDGDLGIPDVVIEQLFRQAFDYGGGANQAHACFADQRTISSSGTDSIDLAGSLGGLLGGTLTFTSVKEIFLYADAANTGNLKVGRGVTNAFVGPFQASAVGLLLPPGGIIHLRNPSASGWTVTAATGDILAVENLVAATVNFTAILLGETS